MKPIETNDQFRRSIGTLYKRSRAQRLSSVERCITYAKSRYRNTAMHNPPYWLTWIQCLSELREALAEGADE